MQNVTQNTSLVPFNQPRGLTITTTDGQTLTVASGNSAVVTAAGNSLVDRLGGTGGGQPLPKLIAVQPKDSRGIDIALAGQYVLSQTEYATDETGKKVKLVTFSAGFGSRVQGRVVGYKLQRSYMPKFDPRNTSEDANNPLCASDNFVTPDAQFDGKFSHQCVAINAKNGLLTAVCPMAAWGARDPATGKSAKPACNEAYVLCVALLVNGEWQYAEVFFKSMAAKAGLALVQQLRQFELKGWPLYTYPIELGIADAGVGYSITGRLLAPLRSDPSYGTPEEHEIEALEAGVQRWAEAVAFDEVRAKRIFDDPTGTGGEQTLDQQIGDQFGPASPAVTTGSVVIVAGAPEQKPAAPPALSSAPTALPKRKPLI